MCWTIESVGGYSAYCELKHEFVQSKYPEFRHGSYGLFFCKGVNVSWCEASRGILRGPEEPWKPGIKPAWQDL